MKELLMIAMIMWLVSCNHYYKATLINAPSNLEKATVIDSLTKQKKYLILRKGNTGYLMRNAQISRDKTRIISTLQTAGVDHRLHFVHGRSGNYQYNNKIPNERHVLDEVHFYLPPDAVITPGPSNFLVASIQKMEAITKDKKRTSRSAMAGFITGLLGLAVIATLLISSICFLC